MGGVGGGGGGGGTGDMPALGGWVAALNQVTFEGLILMLIVALWSSLHIWTLATYYVEDYKRANVPMLPVVYGVRSGLKGTLVVAFIVVVLTVLASITGVLSKLLLPIPLTVLLSAVVMIVKGLRSRRYSEYSFKAFKLVNVYMGMLFATILLSKTGI